MTSVSLKEWERLNDEICSEMKHFSENYKCRKCPNDNHGIWCEHLLETRYRKFRKRIINQINSLGSKI